MNEEIKQNPNPNPRINTKQAKWAKAFLIIGMIATPLAAILTYGIPTQPPADPLAYYGVLVFFGLIYYQISITIGLVTWRKLNRAKCKQDVLVRAIVSIFLVSFIGGILICSMNENEFKTNWVKQEEVTPVIEKAKEEK